MNISSLFLDIGPEEAAAAAAAKNGLTVLTMQQAKRIKFALRNRRPVREATAQLGPATINTHETRRQSEPTHGSLPPPPRMLWSSPALIGLDSPTHMHEDSAGDVARTTHPDEFQKEKPANTNADTNAKSRKRRRLLHMEERTDSLLQGVQKFRNFAKLKLVETPKPLYH
jgi:hypothetical protein